MTGTPGAAMPPRRVVVAGGTGMIGRALSASLLGDGIEVVVLSRDPRQGARRVAAGAEVLAWDPASTAGLDELAIVLAGTNAVVNTSGTPVGPLPWTAGRRRTIVDSRVGTNQRLVEAMAALPEETRPKVFVSAAGTDGYTGLDAEPATEATDISSTTGFLEGLSRDWEAAAEPATRLGVRVVLVRTAFVLARRNPLLGLFSLPTRLFVGGPIGGGQQWFSWIHIDDLVRAYRLAIEDQGLSGPVNAASPNPVRQAAVARAMGEALHRPSFFPVPAWPLRLVLREEATLILGSRRVVPARLIEAGMAFAYPTIDGALRDTL